MKPISALLLILTVMATAVRADDDADGKAAAKATAQEAAQATLDGDYAKLIDLTYPEVVTIMGGRDKAIETIAQTIAQVKAQGIVLKGMEVGEPGDIEADEDETLYVIIPTKTSMEFPQGKINVNSYFVGVSDDDGDTWTFVDGSGLGDEKFRDQVLPGLPDDLELPAAQQPEVILNK